MNTEAAAVRVTQQPMVLESCSLSLAPKYWETMTLVPHRDPDEKHQQQVKNGTGAAHSRQGVVSHKFSHDDAVYGVIKLLRDVSDDHRDRKKCNVFPWFPPLSYPRVQIISSVKPFFFIPLFFLIAIILAWVLKKTTRLLSDFPSENSRTVPVFITERSRQPQDTLADP